MLMEKSKPGLNYQGNLKHFLNPLFDELRRRDIAYCVCGNYHDLPEYTSHDVDIWTEEIKEVEKILVSIAGAAGFLPYLYNRTASGSNNILYKINSDAKGMEFVRIDLLKECAWSSFIPLVKSDKILEGRSRYKNFYVAEPIVETSMHLLYPLIQHGRIKEKYKPKIFKYHKTPGFYDTLSEALGERVASDIIKKIGDRDWDSIEGKNLKYRMVLMQRFFLNLDRRRIKYFFDFLWTNIYRLMKPSGLFIAFIGTDGAGKTTIVESLGGFFGGSFMSGKVKKFYWRPYLFPPLRDLLPFKKKTGENGGVQDAEGPVKQSNALFSYIKFFYYFLDYMAGRWKYQSVWSRGGIVCFDRYYYDHIIYPQRFGFNVPRMLMNFMGRFVPRPDLTFFLYAPPEVLRLRKAEHPFPEIVRQVEAYENLISDIPNAHKIDTTYPIEEVQMKIVRICVEFMAGRLSKDG